MFDSKYRNKKVLITGHTGFKGSWLSLVLDYLGAEIFGISIDCKTQKGPYLACGLDKKLQNDIRLDIREGKALKECIQRIKPDFIFHLAAQALVSNSYKYPSETIISQLLFNASLYTSIIFLTLSDKAPTVGLI